MYVGNLPPPPQKNRYDQRLAADFPLDLVLTVQWEKNRLVNPIPPKPKLITSHYQRTDTESSPIKMKFSTHYKALSLGRLLGYNFIPDYKWNSYIRFVSKENGQLHPPVIHYRPKSCIRTKTLFLPYMD